MAAFKGLKAGIIVAAALAIPVLANGCSAANAVSNAAGSLCCSDYKPGTDMSSVKFVDDANNNIEFQAWANAVGDLETVIEGAVTDVTGACRGIATDLGDTNTPPDGGAGSALMTFWCNEAAAQIKTALTGAASASLSINYTPPVCEASFSATANCSAKCQAAASCGASATPPTCSGGTLEVSCSGSCSASATAPTFDCTGTCSGNCTGSCSAQGGVAVDCQGKCDGTCAAGAGAGATGVQADGSCNGKCSGKCTLAASAKVSCGGSCSGTCDAMCTATPGQASVQCGGTCSAKATPLSCKGGTFKASCMASANCDANCSASASAKASCSPPQVNVAAAAAATGSLTTLATTLEANLPAILGVVKGKISIVGGLVAQVGQPSFTLTAEAIPCAVIIAASSVQAVTTDLPAVVSATGSVTGSLSGSLTL